MLKEIGRALGVALAVEAASTLINKKIMPAVHKEYQKRKNRKDGQSIVVKTEAELNAGSEVNDDR